MFLTTLCIENIYRKILDYCPVENLVGDGNCNAEAAKTVCDYDGGDCTGH